MESGPDERPPLGRARVEAEVSTVTPVDLVELQETETVAIIDVSTSPSFIEEHIEGATWVPRYELEPWLESQHHAFTETIVLTADDELVALYAAAAVHEILGHDCVRVLTGGRAEWRGSELSITDGTDGMAFEPRDEVPRSASRQDDLAKQKYLEWEAELGEKYS